MFKRKKKKTGCETPKLRKPTPPPPIKSNPNFGYQPQYTSTRNPPPLPISGSNAVKLNPNYVPPASVKKFCPYETPCGWCCKWDKKCDKKIGCGDEKPQRGLRVKINPIDDAIDEPIDTLVNKLCTSESNHEWECCGVSSLGWDYICKKCYAHKKVPYTTTEIDTYPTVTATYDNLAVTIPIKDSADHMWNNNNEYDYKEN